MLGGHMPPVLPWFLCIRKLWAYFIILFSAGVGRTGTIIALDICLDQLKVEDRIDVRGVVSFLREQRTQMVQVLVSKGLKIIV